MYAGGSPTTRAEEESLEGLEGLSKGSLGNPALVCGMSQIDCDEESSGSETGGESAVDNSIADYIVRVTSSVGWKSHTCSLCW